MNPSAYLPNSICSILGGIVSNLRRRRPLRQFNSATNQSAAKLCRQKFRCPIGGSFLAGRIVPYCAIESGETVMMNGWINDFPSENGLFREKQIWRKGWDSNPRWVAPRSISSRVP